MNKEKDYQETPDDVADNWYNILLYAWSAFWSVILLLGLTFFIGWIITKIF